jgi:hypothetical protein
MGLVWALTAATAGCQHRPAYVGRAYHEADSAGCAEIEAGGGLHEVLKRMWPDGTCGVWPVRH